MDYFFFRPRGTNVGAAGWEPPLLADAPAGRRLALYSPPVIVNAVQVPLSFGSLHGPHVEVLQALTRKR